MHCRTISEGEYDGIASELVNVECQSGSIKTVSGRHPEFGVTILLREAARCLIVVEDPTLLDVSVVGVLPSETRLR